MERYRFVGLVVQLSSFLNRHDTTQGKKSKPLPKRRQCFLEPLENRMMLACEPLGAAAAVADTFDTTVHSAIVWTNRGDNGGSDSDNFEATYGAATAPIARAIVDRAIDDWERVILRSEERRV